MPPPSHPRLYPAYCCSPLMRGAARSEWRLIPPVRTLPMMEENHRHRVFRAAASPKCSASPFPLPPHPSHLSRSKAKLHCTTDSTCVGRVAFSAGINVLSSFLAPRFHRRGNPLQIAVAQKPRFDPFASISTARPPRKPKTTSAITFTFLAGGFDVPDCIGPVVQVVREAVEPVKSQALCYPAARSLNSGRPLRQHTYQGYIYSLKLAYWLCAMIQRACANLGIGSSVGRNFLSCGGRPVFLLCKGPVKEPMGYRSDAAIPALSASTRKGELSAARSLPPGQSMQAGERNYIIRSGRLLSVNSAKCCPGQKLADYKELKCSRCSVPCQKQSLIDTARGHWKSINQNSPRESEAIVKKRGRPARRVY